VLYPLGLQRRRWLSPASRANKFVPNPSWGSASLHPRLYAFAALRGLMQLKSRNANTRIKPAINHISQHVRRNVRNADHQHATLHHAIVAFADTILNQQ